jgi:uncharacterized protein (DUF1330 family)
MSYRRGEMTTTGSQKRGTAFSSEEKLMKGKKQMAVYAISDTVEITDPQMLAEYVQRIAPTLKKYGVKPLVAGNAGYETIEGIWQTQGMTILEFEDREHFERWYNSPEYQEILPLRMQATSNRALLIKPTN